MTRLLKLAQQFNRFYLHGARSNYRPLVVAGKQVGLVGSSVLQQLLKYPKVFHTQQNIVELNPALRDYDERSEQVDHVLQNFRSQRIFPAVLEGWRDECFDVESVLKMDRSATCLFGVRNYGVKINGYVQHPDRGLCVWLQQRSASKQTYSGEWENMVGGGVPVGQGAYETVVQEAIEEASIPRHLIWNLVSAGCVSFFYENERGLFPDTEYVYDLELPEDFRPENGDGEVQGFELVPAKECLERCLRSDFKITSCPVILDFLIRRGVITPESEVNLSQIVELLHVPLHSLYSYRT